ncbi:BREX-1 system adenine-specific DNA-methyltransferase PglX [Burkholderia orbicola]|uniref:BREX-1 system adenine-specific DNA-methyltransferase PglX n=1 Tax=Burkholderia orbicola TaxID=2978683 RepID=UPI002FE2387B
MNKANLKAYAPHARRDFIAAVTARANLLGISTAGSAQANVRGDLVIIEGREWPIKINAQREKLLRRIERRGFEQAMEEVAYTWFNRFAALRFMELHGYFDHGWRVLSSRDGGLPEILRYASEVSLPGLNKQVAREMQLAGTQDNELYKLLLVAQCNDLSRSMPFLFEQIDDETELLLPENLLRTDSIVAKLVEGVPEEDWAQIEAVGWLYQFYISERKDEVIGKVVRTEDIPAATQIFTPNWIVKYLTQNTIGAIWLGANPDSLLRSGWLYASEPARQTEEVEARVNTLLNERVQQDGGTLSPEGITVLDPACGSGHILVEAYEVLKSIYLDRGYRLRDIPRLILEKNLFGLDMDDRAAQLAGFALLMKARADDRRLLDNPPALNIVALQESSGLDLDNLSSALASSGVGRDSIKELINLFANAKTFGSLLTVSAPLDERLLSIAESLEQARRSGDLYAKAAAEDLAPLVAQALILARKFDAVVANPPYMGSNYYTPTLKKFVNAFYAEGKPDLYGCFILRNLSFAKAGGIVGMITIPNWMFNSSFEKLRAAVFDAGAISSLVHNGRGVWGADFGSASFCIKLGVPAAFKGTYKRLFEKQGSVSDVEELNQRFFTAKPFYAAEADFDVIPCRPFAYWATPKVLEAFRDGQSLAEIASPRQGLATGDNGRFLRFWHEVSVEDIGFDMASRSEARESGRRWFPCTKGGPFRKWYGNQDYVVDWQDDGQRIKENVDPVTDKPKSRVQNEKYYFRAGISWSTISISSFSMRYMPAGHLFETKGAMCFADDDRALMNLLAFSNTCLVNSLLTILSPSVDYHEGPIGRLPIIAMPTDEHIDIAREAVGIAKEDWDSFETSYGFRQHPWVRPAATGGSAKADWERWSEVCAGRVSRIKALEEQNNTLFIQAYGLEEELSHKVSDDQITLSRADREKDCERLVSFAIGCMMGRYSLDEPGLIYAGSKNVAFAPSRYESFAADSDGIVPITSELWFDDDAAARVREFVGVVWGQDSLADNLAWLAGGLAPKGDETAEETLRRYLFERFFKDHTQTYKRRPIYWQFSSGKLGAFQALVYQHRYHEGTIARLRSEYVIPLAGKMASRLEILEADGAAAASTAARNKIQKQIDVLRKKQVELFAYDEKLRHYADMRISIDLDNGVKENYGKFAELVSDSKIISGAIDD